MHLWRFTGPQIQRLQQRHPKAYVRTALISLVSPFIASMILGHIALFDISDVCGMNLYNIEAGCWDEKLLELAAGDFGVEDLKAKLGDVPADAGIHLGNISSITCEDTVSVQTALLLLLHAIIQRQYSLCHCGPRTLSSH
jgi:sugar (pentulose or hexulose) kinase